MGKNATAIVKEKTFSHPVEMPLTDRELLVYADELATLDSELTTINQRHQSEKGRFKADVERVGERQTVILNRLRTNPEGGLCLENVSDRQGRRVWFHWTGPGNILKLWKLRKKNRNLKDLSIRFKCWLSVRTVAIKPTQGAATCNGRK